jgi:hypothetical protein
LRAHRRAAATRTDRHGRRWPPRDDNPAQPPAVVPSGRATRPSARTGATSGTPDGHPPHHRLLEEPACARPPRTALLVAEAARRAVADVRDGRADTDDEAEWDTQSRLPCTSGAAAPGLQWLAWSRTNLARARSPPRPSGHHPHRRRRQPRVRRGWDDVARAMCTVSPCCAS